MKMSLPGYRTFPSGDDISDFIAKARKLVGPGVGFYFSIGR
jgi:hypothetical protein